MADVETFERQLSDQLDLAALGIEPDVVEARARIDDLVTSQGQNEPRRGTFLAAAAAVTVLAGGALVAQLAGTWQSDTDPAVTDTSVLSSSPDADESNVAVPTTAAPATTTAPTSAPSTSIEELTGEPTWRDLPVPLPGRTAGNATRVVATQTEPGDLDGTTTIETRILADDGRSLRLEQSEELAETNHAELLSVLARERDNPADGAAAALLRASGVDPDRATPSTIQTSTWTIAGELLTLGNLEPDQWSDVIRLMSTIDNIGFIDGTVTGGGTITAEIVDGPGNERWTLRIDAAQGRPVDLTTRDADGAILRQITYVTTRIQLADPEPNLIDPAVADGEALTLLVTNDGLQLDATASGRSTKIAWGEAIDTANSAVATVVGQQAPQPTECSTGLFVYQWSTGITTFATANGELAGWALTGPTPAATPTGLTIGSTVNEVRTVFPGVDLEPGPIGPAFFDGAIVYVATSENPTSRLSHMNAGQVCPLLDEWLESSVPPAEDDGSDPARTADEEPTGSDSASSSNTSNSEKGDDETAETRAGDE